MRTVIKKAKKFFRSFKPPSQKQVIRQMMSNFIGTMIEATYDGAEEITVEFYLFQGLKFQMHKDVLRQKLFKYVGRSKDTKYDIPDTVEEVGDFLVDLLPKHVSLFRQNNFAVGGFKVETKWNRKKLIEKITASFKAIKGLK